MSDTGSRAPRLTAADAGAAERDARHRVLADLLAAYADGELPAESMSQVEAHLVGCAPCRHDVAVQRALRDRLGAEPVAAAPAALRDRIRAATLAAPPPAPAAAPGGLPDDAPRPAPRRAPAVRRAAAALVALVACALLGAYAAGGAWGTAARTGAGAPPNVDALAAPGAAVPLLAEAASDFRRTAATELPGRARDLDAVRSAVGFAVEPLQAPALRLLGAWTATLGGEPAAVLAYRHGDAMVLQYLTPDAVYFRHPALRAAAARRRPFAAHDGGVAIVGWAQAATGALLVGDDAPALAALAAAAAR